MTKTILLATIMAVTILGLATASIVLNTPAEANHPISPVTPICVDPEIINGNWFLDPTLPTCLLPDDCPFGLSDEGLRSEHCSQPSGDDDDDDNDDEDDDDNDDEDDDNNDEDDDD